MQASKDNEPNLVVWNLRVRTRGASLGALVALCAFVPFLAGSATPAVKSRNIVLAAGAPAQALPTDTPALLPSLDAVRGAVPPGGGPILFPDLTLPPLAGEGGGGPLLSDDVVLAGPTGPVYGTALLSSSMVGSAGFIRPVNAPEVSGFGPRIHPVLGRAMFHTGIDLGAACSTPIRAAADGKVVYAARNPSWGNRVIIAHSPTLKTAYGHQSRMLVRAGDVVKQGQVIGLVGTTGWSTGCHLHFDVIVNNQYVDPAPYLGFAGSSAAAVPFFAPAPGRPGSGAVPAGPKNPNPPVQDGDVPISSATPHKPAKQKPAGTSTPTPPKASKPATTSRPPATSTSTQPPSSTPPSTTKPPSPTSTTPPPPTTTKTPASSTSPSSTSTTTKPSTTTPPPPTTTKTPASSTSSSSTSTTTKPPTSTPPTTTTTSAPPAQESSPSCETTPDSHEASTSATTTPSTEQEPVVDPSCDSSKVPRPNGVTTTILSTTAAALKAASAAVTP